MRPSKRKDNEMRDISFEVGVSKHAEGSCLVKFGDTHVLCTASVETRVPPWLRHSGSGWVTAEYGMLPRSTGERMRREAAAGKQSGRTQEIQRLIGRSLRSVIDLKVLGENQISLDCDVIQADGGTRTAAITGAFIAMKQSINFLMKEKQLKKDPTKEFLAAISCGIYRGEAILDLDYKEDSEAEADANFVMTENNKIIEIQATAEQFPFRKKICRINVTGKIWDNSNYRKTKRNFREFIKMCKKISGDEIVIASHNIGKIKEFRDIFKNYGYILTSSSDYNLEEPEENGSTFAENALIKAMATMQGTGKVSLSDDSGLCIKELNNDPGIFSARWAGVNKDFNLAMVKVEKKLLEKGLKVPKLISIVL